MAVTPLPVTGDGQGRLAREMAPGNGIGAKFCREVVDRVVKSEKAVCILNSRAEVDEELGDKLRSMNIGSVMCVPLIGSSQILGVIYVDSLKNPNGFREKDLALVTDLSRRAAIAMEHVLLQEKLQ